MPGLSFLSKKSWHTSNISNQEKVWLAEQKAEAEAVKTKELQDQIKVRVGYYDSNNIIIRCMGGRSMFRVRERYVYACLVHLYRTHLLW